MAETVTLGSIANLKTGPFGTQFSASEYSATGTPILNVKSIGHGVVLRDDLDYVPDSVRDRLAAHTLVEGDIVFARKGSVDRHAYVSANEAGWIQGSDCIRVQCKHGVNSRFISHWLKLDAVKEQVNNSAVGSTMASLNTDILAGIHVRLPDPETQNAVAAFLSRVEDQVALNTQINDNLQAMLQTLYGYWFLQFDFPDENGRPYRSSGGRMVWNDQLKREIPAGWRVGANEELFDGIRTGLNPRQNFSLRTQGIAYLTVKNLTKDGGLDFASCDYIDEEAMAKVRRRSDLRVGDILFASIAPLRRCFLIYEEPRDWEINESVFSIRPRRGVTTPEYVYCHLMSDAFVKQAEQSSTGSIFKGIRHETLKGLMTVIPPEIIAQSYASAVSPIMRMRNDNLEENRKLQELRDWLLPMLMNGQATVASSDKLSFCVDRTTIHPADNAQRKEQFDAMLYLLTESPCINLRGACAPPVAG